MTKHERKKILEILNRYNDSKQRFEDIKNRAAKEHEQRRNDRFKQHKPNEIPDHSNHLKDWEIAMAHEQTVEFLLDEFKTLQYLVKTKT